MASKLEELMAKRAAAKAATTTTAESKAAELKAQVDELPQAVVEASANDKVNPPESKEALAASLGATPPAEAPPPAAEAPPVAKGRGRGRPPRAAESAPAPDAAPAIEGRIVEAIDEHDVPQATIVFPAGTIIPVGARVRIEVLG